MAPTSLRIKSQHPPVVGKPARAGPLPTLQIRPLAFLWPVWPPEHFQSTANEFTFRASAFAIFPAWITSMLPAKYHLLLEAFWDLCPVWFSPQTLSPPGILILHGCSVVCLPHSLSRRTSAPQKRARLCPLLYRRVWNGTRHTVGALVSGNVRITFLSGLPSPALLFSLKNLNIPHLQQPPDTAADTVLDSCLPPSLGPGAATC